MACYCIYDITYIYSAVGEKLAKKITNGAYQYYAGSMVYKSDKTLNYLLMDEGMVNKLSGGYEYHLKDHLGNVRVTFQPNGTTTTVKQATEYYPFGMNYAQSPGGTNKYLYNGKEKQDDNLSGTYLDWYDYGARIYDPQIGRFHTQDAFAEKYFNFTQYQYGANNPELFIDINGDSLQVTNEAILAIYNALDKNAYVKFDVKNGVIDPESFKEQAENSCDIVLQDLYEIASNEKMVELSVSDCYDFKDSNGKIQNSDSGEMKFGLIYTDDSYNNPKEEKFRKLYGYPLGKTMSGNKGRALFPESTTGSTSTNGNIQIILNAYGNLD